MTSDGYTNVTEFPAGAETDTPVTSPSTPDTDETTSSTTNETTTTDNTPKPPPLELARSQARSYFRSEDYEKKIAKELEEVRRRSRNLASILLVCATLFAVFLMVSIQNAAIYRLQPDTMTLLNRALNVGVTMTVPFALGMSGAFARLLLAGVAISEQAFLLIGSGAMAAFSWIGIKSGVFLTLITPHIPTAQPHQDIDFVSASSDFYTLAFVAIAVGMFSTNLYMLISHKVEKLVSEREKDKR